MSMLSLLFLAGHIASLWENFLEIQHRNTHFLPIANEYPLRNLDDGIGSIGLIILKRFHGEFF